MKYVVFRKEEANGDAMEIPILFPNQLVHQLVAEKLLEMEGMEGFKVVSAGECSSMDVSPKCSGRSDTLKVESRGKVDSDLFPMYDYMHGLVYA